MKKRSLREFAALLGVTLQRDAIIEGFAIDSRLIKQGEVFFALTGAHTDGHDHLETVAKKGAIAAVVSKNRLNERSGLDLIPVENVLSSLQELARKQLEQQQIKIIAITGSIGKTTTKEFIASLLADRFKVAKTPGNYNTKLTVPLTILNEDQDQEIFILEMGMTEKGDIENLIKIAPPDIALITKIGLAHAEFFPDGIDGIVAAKAEIFSHPKTHLGIFNAKNLPFSSVFEKSTCKKLTFSDDNSASDFTLRRFGDQYLIEEKEKPSPLFSLPFSESHFCENFVAAAAVARTLELSWEEIISRLPYLNAFRLRFEKIERDGVLFINDCYNANPDSMEAALTNLPKALGKKIAVLGSMKELGRYSEKSHLEIGQLALNHIDYLLCLGEECLPIVSLFKKEKRPVEFFSNLDDLKKRVFGLISSGDVVLIKGSRFHQLQKILEEA